MTGATRRRCGGWPTADSRSSSTTSRGSDDRRPPFPFPCPGCGGARGRFPVIFRAGTKTYAVKSSDVDLLGVSEETPSGKECDGRRSTCIGRADIRWTASLADVTQPRKPITVGSNLALQVTVTDKGDRRGSGDSIGVTLWDGNTLLFSSNWTGAQTLEQLLKAGKVTVD
jgi:hypothetical protein